MGGARDHRGGGGGAKSGWAKRGGRGEGGGGGMGFGAALSDIGAIILNHFCDLTVDREAPEVVCRRGTRSPPPVSVCSITIEKSFRF